MRGRLIPTISGKRVEIFKNCTTALFWPLMVDLGTVMALVCVSLRC